MELQELGKQLFIVTAVSAPSAASEAPHDECVSIGDLLDVKDKHGVWHVAEVLDMRRDPQTQYPAVKVLLHAGRSEAQWLHFGAEQCVQHAQQAATCARVMRCSALRQDCALWYAHQCICAASIRGG